MFELPEAEQGKMIGIYENDVAGLLLEKAKISKNPTWLAETVLGSATDANIKKVKLYLGAPTFIEMLEDELTGINSEGTDVLQIQARWQGLFKEMGRSISEQIVSAMEKAREKETDIGLNKWKDWVKISKEIMSAELGLKGIPVEPKLTYNVNKTDLPDKASEKVDLEESRAAVDRIDRHRNNKKNSFLPLDAAPEEAQIVEETE